MKLNEVLREHFVSESLRTNGGVDWSEEVASPVGARLQDLETVLSVIRKINNSLILSDVLDLVIDHAIRITEADRGFLMLADKEGRLQYIVGHDKNKNVIHPESFEVSQSVLDDVYSTGESLCVEDALNDERFEQRLSIVDLELKTIMCAPLKTHEETIGVVYVDSRYIHSVNKDEILRLFEILAGQAAIAIQNARLYEDLKKAYEELRDANEYIIKSEKLALHGEMAAEVSHELKNLLSVALLQSQRVQYLIQQGDLALSEKISTDVIASIQKINIFSDNLLVRSGVTCHMKPIQFNEFVKNFASFIRLLRKFRGGKIVVFTDEQVPEFMADSDQIQQVLLNLANNAIEAYPEATITFVTQYDCANNVVRLSVQDDGPGLDPRVKEKVFVEKITTKPDGHGFGLPVCRKIVQNHNGDIRAESEPGHGTKFIITLPVAV